MKPRRDPLGQLGGNLINKENWRAKLVLHKFSGMSGEKIESVGGQKSISAKWSQDMVAIPATAPSSGLQQEVLLGSRKT
jgi:hypothetical protein